MYSFAQHTTSDVEKTPSTSDCQCLLALPEPQSNGPLDHFLNHRPLRSFHSMVLVSWGTEMFSVAWLGTNSGLVVLQILFAVFFSFFFMYHPASDGYPTWLNLFLSVFEGSTPPIRWVFLSRRWSIPSTRGGRHRAGSTGVEVSHPMICALVPLVAFHTLRVACAKRDIYIVTFWPKRSLQSLVFSVAVVCCQHFVLANFTETNRSTGAVATNHKGVLNHGDWNFMV